MSLLLFYFLPNVSLMLLSFQTTFLLPLWFLPSVTNTVFSIHVCIGVFSSFLQRWATHYRASCLVRHYFITLLSHSSLSLYLKGGLQWVFITPPVNLHYFVLYVLLLAQRHTYTCTQVCFSPRQWMVLQFKHHMKEERLFHYSAIVSPLTIFVIDSGLVALSMQSTLKCVQENY